jgi:hypothetical protein
MDNCPRLWEQRNKFLLLFGNTVFLGSGSRRDSRQIFFHSKTTCVFGSGASSRLWDVSRSVKLLLTLARKMILSSKPRCAQGYIFLLRLLRFLKWGLLFGERRDLITTGHFLSTEVTRVAVHDVHDFHGQLIISFTHTQRHTHSHYFILNLLPTDFSLSLSFSGK